MKKTKSLIILLFVIMMTTTTVYAYTNKIKEGDRLLQIEYTNIKSNSNKGTVTYDSETGLNFNAKLEIPGDYYEFTVDLVNTGSKDAQIEKVEITQLTDEQKRYLSYTVTYEDNSQINVGDIIKSKDKKTIKVRLEYKYDITIEDLPTKDEKFNPSFNIIMTENK
ncbi:MAG: hypothetical protein IKO49_02765 [Bacilli bacterium]|nr:hypothetical protein [Bacilli bacterium]